jgi:large subunit ribosomal protein L30
MTSATKKIKITQVKSGIGHIREQKMTLKALGILKIRHSVIHNDTPSIRGMVKSIGHLVTIQEERGE